MSQREVDEPASAADGNAICATDETSTDESKPVLAHHLDDINIKQMQEILPLVTEYSLDLRMITPPVVRY